MKYEVSLLDSRDAVVVGPLAVDAYNPKEAWRKVVKEVQDKLSIPRKEDVLSRIDYIVDAKGKTYNPPEPKVRA